MGVKALVGCRGNGTEVEGLGWVKRSCDWYRGHRVGINGQIRLWMAKDGYRGPRWV